MITEVEDVLSFARGPRIASANTPSAPVFQRLVARAAAGTPAEQSGIVRDLVPGLAVSDPIQAACVAVTCGTLVERGAAPTEAGTAIVARLEAAARATPDEHQALRWLGLAAMACLCRSPSLRGEAQRMIGLADALEPLEENVPEAWFVRRVLELVDNLELLVLAPEPRRGYRVRLEAVRTSFHLFTLLQGALIGDPGAGWLAGERTESKVIARARGEHGPVLPDHARFHFHDWTGLAADGTLRGDLRSTIWGEGSPRDIALFDGARVVLLGPTILGSRSWDSSFFAAFHDALKSSVHVVTVLSGAEVGTALEAIAARVREVEGRWERGDEVAGGSADRKVASGGPWQRLARTSFIVGLLVIGVIFVWLNIGLIHTLHALSAPGISAAEGAKVEARGIAEALYDATFGMLFAIPALLVSWWASRRARSG